MNKVVSAGALLLAVQAVLIGGYLAVEAWRAPSDASRTPPDTIATPLPELVVRLADGSFRDVSELRGRPALLHFWATWCPPCRKELPALLNLADRGTARIWLVALDDDWEPVRRFLDRPVPAYVVLADGGEVEDRFGVRALPETFVIDRAGNMTLRFRQPQDWTQRATLELLPEELR